MSDLDPNKPPFEGYITTIYGWRDPALFERKEGVFENEDEKTTWTEYWDGNTLVHRSVHVTVKKMPVFSSGEAASFS